MNNNPYNVYIVDVVTEANPTVTVGVDFKYSPPIEFSARVFMDEVLVGEIDSMDGWQTYHKEWSKGITRLLEDYNATTDVEVVQCITQYLNNY